MSTQINVVVDSGDLREQEKQLRTAGRQAQLEKERTARIEAEATTKRNENLKAQGLSPDSRSFFATSPTQVDIERRPAANRISGAGYFVLVSNATVPISFNGNFPVYGDSFNAQQAGRQPYNFYLGPPSTPTLLPPGPEIPVEMTLAGLFDFENYDEAVYYLVVESTLSKSNVAKHVPLGWTEGNTYKSSFLNIATAEKIPWVIQSLNNTNNTIFIEGFPFSLGYWVVSGYIKNSKLYGVQRIFATNTANVGDRLGNFYGLPLGSRLDLAKEPISNEWLLPSPPWNVGDNPFEREP